MAEVLGTAASAIGVASFAIQIAESALKLKNLWCFVRDAPEDIQLMIEDVESFNEILSEIQMQTVSHHVPMIDTKISDKCIERCAQASTKLSSALLLLESATKKSPIRGGFRVKLKEATILKLRSQLEIAKNCMWAARHNYCSALDRYEHSILDSRLSLLHHDLLRLETRISPRPSDATIVDASSRSCGNTMGDDSRLSSNSEHNDSVEIATFPVQYQTKPLEQKVEILLQSLTLGTENYWLSYFIGSIEYKKLRLQSKHIQDSESNPLFVEHNIFVRWRLPFWFANISWETCLKRTILGWETHMHVDHFITEESPAVSHIETGNVAALQVMLSRREITPKSYIIFHDDEGLVDPTELLEHAISLAQCEICELLISLGASSMEFRPCERNLLAYAIVRKKNNLHHRSKFNQIIRLLLEKGNVDPDMASYYGLERHSVLSLAVTWGLPEDVTLLKSFSYPPFQKRTLVEKFDAAWHPGITGEAKLENLRLLLGWGSTDPEAAHFDFGDPILKDMKRSKKLLDYFAHNLGYALGSQRLNTISEILAYFTRMVREWKLRWVNSEIVTTLSPLLRGFSKGLHHSVYPERLLPRGLRGTTVSMISPIYIYRITSGAIDVSTVVQTWVRALGCAGITGTILEDFFHAHQGNMVVYSFGATNSDIPRSNDWHTVMVRFISFRSGPQVFDWGTCLSDPIADAIACFFGEFWYMVENPWICIPGAWIEEDRD